MAEEELSQKELLRAVLHTVRQLNQAQTAILSGRIEGVRREVEALDKRVDEFKAEAKPAIDQATAIRVGTKWWALLAFIGTAGTFALLLIDWVRSHFPGAK